jgi:hypothetical protein
MLRNACYTLVVGLSMMRDSEVHEIAPGSVVEYYGTPAIKSAKGKHDPNLPIKHWWITAPVAEAIVVAEQLSQQHDRLFPPLLRQSADVSRSPKCSTRSSATSTPPAPRPDCSRSRPAKHAHICSGGPWQC